MIYRTAVEGDALVDLLVRSFAYPSAGWIELRDLVGLANCRTLSIDDRIVAGLCLYPAAHWFGGRRISMNGLAGVGVAAEHRGQGVGRRLLVETLRESREAGFACATLFASSERVYRSVGFEPAGSHVRYRVPLAGVPAFGRELPVRRLEPAEYERLHPLHLSRALAGNGHLDRSGPLWYRVTRDRELPTSVYLIGPDAAPEGYAAVAPIRNDRLHHDLEVRDVVALTARALDRFWTLLADHRSLADHVFLRGPALDARLLRLPEETASVAASHRWLVRPLDVPRMLAERGYDPDVRGVLALEVEDPLFPENAGRWTLEVSGGEGRVTSGGRGEVKLGVRGLAPLFTGWLSAEALAGIGLVEGPAAALRVATRVFAGPEPWMADMF